MRCNPERWWRGLLPLALLGAAAGWWVTPTFEAELGVRLRERATALGQGEWAALDMAGRDVVLTGEAPSPEDRDRLVAGLREAALVRRLEDRTTLRPVPGGYAWSAERQGARLTLRGSVPDEAVRAALAEEARQLGPSLTLVDETAPREGAPAPFREAARLALRLASELEGGRAGLRGLTLDVRGTAPDSGTYARAMAALRALPEGIEAGEVAITPPTLQPFTFLASREGNRLVLGGHVASETLRAEIVAASRAAMPEAVVEDRMLTAISAPAGLDPLAWARQALGLLARLDDGRVAVEDRTVSVEGRTGDKGALPGIEAALRAGLPAPLVLGAVRLQAVPVVPYTFAARRGGGAVTLAGHVPDEATKADILGQARRRFLGDRIVDRLRLGDGAPPGFAAAALYLMDQLGQLASGEAALQGTQLQVTGEGLYAQAVEVQQERAPRAAPPGFTAEARLRVRGVEAPLDPAACGREIAAVLGRSAIEFESGGTAFKRASYGPLDEVAAILRRCGTVRVEIAAHLDAEANEAATTLLSLRRAQAVRDHLARAGIDPGRLQAAGYGGTRPLAPNDTEENRARNRRVEITVQGSGG